MEAICWLTSEGKNYFFTDKDVESNCFFELSYDNAFDHETIKHCWKISTQAKKQRFPINATVKQLPNEIWNALVEGKFKKILKESGYEFFPTKKDNNQYITVKEYDNGKLMQITNYKNNKLNGKSYLYDIYGNLLMEKDWKNGHCIKTIDHEANLTQI